MFEIVGTNVFNTDWTEVLRVTFPRYHAASKQPIRFKFDLTGTPIKSGSIWFDIPSGWAKPSLDDADGEATVDLIVADTANTAGAADSDNELSEDIVLKTNGNQIRVDIAKGAGKGTPITFITIQYGKAGNDDKYQGRVQRDADPNKEIIGRFNSGTSGSRGHPAGIASVTIDNAADGSGTATISSSSSDRRSAKAGSTDNRVTVTFKAEGTMDGGRVSLEIPDGWGDMQELASAEANYIAVRCLIAAKSIRTKLIMVTGSLSSISRSLVTAIASNLSIAMQKPSQILVSPHL